LSMGKWVRIERRFQAKRSGPTRIGWKTMAADGASGAGIFIVDMQLAKTSSGCNTGDQFLSFNIDGKFSDTTIACSNNIPTQLLFNGLYTSPIIGKGKYEWTVYKDGVAIHTATQELECDPSYGGCPWVEYIQTLPISTGTYKVRLKGKKKFLLWWYVDVFDICSDEITVTMPENASANLSINNNFSNQVSVCEFDPIIVDASSSDCETSWFLSLQAADGNWSGVGTEYTRWFSGQAPANLDLRLAAAILWNVTIDPDTRWRVKIAVGTPYDSKTRFLTVKNCGFTDSWTSVGNPQTDLSNQDGKIYVGDFNGDGDDEMLQVTGSVMDMLEYRNGNWVTLWTNGGSTNQAIYPYRNRLEVGDFDGDGKDEVLGIASWMTMFHFDNGQWNWGWSDYGDPNASGGLYPYRYNVKVGDFDGDSKDELFGVASWMTMFNFDGGQWNWGWSDDGDPTKSGGLFPYKSNLRVGDFDNDGRDDLLGLASWATWFSFNNGWTWKTSTSGGPLAGWALPFSNQDKLITGDVDNLDGKSELLMFDRGPGAGRMQTADLNGANQFARRYYNQNSGMFFLTPLYQSGCVTDYFRVKPIAGQPDQVMMHLRCGLPLSSAALNLYAMHKIAQPNANYRMDNESVFSAEMEGMVYPNPATDVLSVQLPKGSEDASWQIAITNLQGQTVWKGQAQGQVSVEVKDYPRGLYLLKATQGKEQWDKRIILQ
ncbi:MAG: T9SS type A sorting domain-containing protein, partial [Bacteroidota bacterium]